MVDDEKLKRFIGQMLSDLGGAASVALVRIGDALGLYKTLHEHGPMIVPSSPPRRGSTSATCANGCRIRRLRTTSPTIPLRRSSLCRRNRR